MSIGGEAAREISVLRAARVIVSFVKIPRGGRRAVEGGTPVRNASQAERARHLLHTRMRAIVVGLLLLAILPCCFHDPCPTPESVRRVTAQYAQQLRWWLCAARVIACFVEELQASVPIRTLAIDVRAILLYLTKQIRKKCQKQSRNGDNKVIHESGTTCPRLVGLASTVVSGLDT